MVLLSIVNFCIVKQLLMLYYYATLKLAKHNQLSGAAMAYNVDN